MVPKGFDLAEILVARQRRTSKPDIIDSGSRRIMQTPRRINDPANSLAVVVAVVLSALLLLGQALFIVPAGKVAVVTTLGKVSGGSRLPGLNLKVPFIQSVYPFDVRTQVKPEEFATLTKDLQVIEATATVKSPFAPTKPDGSTERSPATIARSTPASFSRHC